MRGVAGSRPLRRQGAGRPRARQNPDARTLVKRGSAVTVVLSLGPQRVDGAGPGGPRPCPRAQAALSGSRPRHRPHPRRLRPRATRRRARWWTRTRTPAPPWRPATGVDLLLAMAAPGERYVMPDLVYRDYDQVRPFFEQRGFKLRQRQVRALRRGGGRRDPAPVPPARPPAEPRGPVSLVVATADGASAADDERLAPSLLAADLADFAGALALCEQGGADLVHFDVMDGHFVPNLSFGIPVLKALQRPHPAAARRPPDGREPGPPARRLPGGRRGAGDRPLGGGAAPRPPARAHPRGRAPRPGWRSTRRRRSSCWSTPCRGSTTCW